MHFNVIAISRTLGAGGELLGESLADELGFRYVDAEILDRAAALAGVTAATVARAEGRKGLLARVVDSLTAARSGAAAADGAAQQGAGHPEGYEQLIIDVIRETADMEFVVIVAHGASIPLAGRPGLLRLLVTASQEVRTTRVAADTGQTLAAAAKAVEESDRARADYLRRFFGVKDEHATHYDLVINTAALDIDSAAKVILALVRD